MIYEWVHAVASALARRGGYRIIKEYRFPRHSGSTLDLAIAILRSKFNPITFVQVGANDGVLNDPLRKHLCQGGFLGALCEPVPEMFAILKENCSTYQGVQLLNCAVSDRDGAMQLYAPRDLWQANHHQKVSCNIDNMAKVGLARKDLEAIDVEGVTLKSVLGKVGLSTLDLLVIDAEGHDFAVLNKGFADAVEPSVIFLEVLHLTKAERNSLRLLLNARGYSFFEDLKDCLAIKKCLLP